MKGMVLIYGLAFVKYSKQGNVKGGYRNVMTSVSGNYMEQPIGDYNNYNNNLGYGLGQQMNGGNILPGGIVDSSFLRPIIPVNLGMNDSVYRGYGNNEYGNLYEHGYGGIHNVHSHNRHKRQYQDDGLIERPEQMY